jgi:hypothetical protein
MKTYHFRMPTMATIVHRGEHIAHCLYLAAATGELHGLYSISAGCLLCMTIVGFFIHVEQGPVL